MPFGIEAPDWLTTGREGLQSGISNLTPSNIGEFGSNIDIPGAFGYGGGGSDTSYTPQGSAWSQNWGSSSVPTSQSYLTDAKAYGLQQGLNTGNLNYAPQRIAAEGERTSMGLGVQQALAEQAAGGRYLNQDYDIGSRKLALQQQSNAIDVGANARKPGYLTGLHDLALGGMNAQAAQARRGLESQLTGRGAFTSIGGQQGRYDITQDLARQTQGENIQYGERMAQTQDEKQKLDLAGKDLGISGEQLRNELSKGLERLNLSAGFTVSDLMNKINSSNLQDAAMGQKIYNDAMQYSDYYQRSGLFQGANSVAADAAAVGYNPLVGSGTEKVYGGRR